jgi:hypothetical protein
MEDVTWEVVCSVSGMINASILVGKLETEGIPTKLKYEAVGTIYAITVDGLGEVKIMVPADYLDRARSVLSQTYDEDELEWENTET